MGELCDSEGKTEHMEKFGAAGSLASHFFIGMSFAG